MSRSEFRGCPEPRIAIPGPARLLNRDTTYGFDCIDFARRIGHPLLEYQENAVIRALEKNPDGRLRFRNILLIAPRQNGKSACLRVATLFRMFLAERPQVILGTAQDLPQATRQMHLTHDMVAGHPGIAGFKATHRRTNGQEQFSLVNGSEYLVKACNAEAGRGLSADMCLMDELRTHRDFDGYGAVLSTTVARPNPQVWMLSNAGHSGSVVLHHVRDTCLSGADDSTLLLEWSAEPGADYDDPRVWGMANPAGGTLITESTLASLRKGPLEVFLTENLAVFVDVMDSAVDQTAWKASADASSSLAGVRDRVCACIDVGYSAGHVAVAVAARMPSGLIRIELADSWDTTAEARAGLGPLLDRIKPAATGWFPGGPGDELAAVLRGRRGIHELRGQEVNEACQGLASLTAARQITHGNDPLLNAHIAATKKRLQGDTWRFDRRSSRDLINAAYATAGAVHLVSTLPPSRRAGIHVIQ